MRRSFRVRLDNIIYAMIELDDVQTLAEGTVETKEIKGGNVQRPSAVLVRKQNGGKR